MVTLLMLLLGGLKTINRDLLSDQIILCLALALERILLSLVLVLRLCKALTTSLNPLLKYFIFLHARQDCLCNFRREVNSNKMLAKFRLTDLK